MQIQEEAVPQQDPTLHGHSLEYLTFSLCVKRAARSNHDATLLDIAHNTPAVGHRSLQALPVALTSKGSLPPPCCRPLNPFKIVLHNVEDT